MSKNNKLRRNVSAKMRSHQTGKFVRVLSYKNCTNDLDSARKEPTGVETRRYLMLMIFCLGSMMSGLSYTTYTIIADVVEYYFRVDYSLVDWTSMVYMLGYIVPLFPIIWLVETKGLRCCFLVGAIGTALGYWITCAYIQRDFFWVIILGQTVIGAFQACFMPLTPQFASVWFGPKEISSVCSVGIFFNTLGNALSCIIPPHIVKSRDLDGIHFEMTIMGIAYGVVSSVVALLAIMFFKERPKLPPSLVQVIVRKSQDDSTKSGSVAIARDIKSLLTNQSFVLHMISYGIGFSVADVIAAILNHMVLKVHPTANSTVGILGMLIHIPGVPASLLFGFIMDKTHKYKETALVVYVATFLSFGFFMGGFYLPVMALYFAAGLLGFFGAGYLPIGLELGAEITYPIPEVTSAGMLIMTGAVFTLVFTYGTDYVLTSYGVLEAQLIILILILIGLICAVFVKPELKRLEACAAAEEANCTHRLQRK